MSGSQLKEAKVILAVEDAPIDCSPPSTEELPKQNFPEVVLAGLGVGKFHGCKGKIIKKLLTPKRFGFSHVGTSDMEATSIKYNMAPTLQQCLFSLGHVMCTEAQH